MCPPLDIQRPKPMTITRMEDGHVHDTHRKNCIRCHTTLMFQAMKQDNSV